MALSDNLIAFLSLEEASGDATDATGNGHTLTDVNTVTSNTGKVGNCRQFTKTSGERLSSASTDFDSSNAASFTVAGWIYFDVLAGSSIYTLASKGWFPGWRLAYRTDFQEFEMLVSDSGTFVTPRAGVVASTSTWYFLVGIWDHVNDLAGVSLNAVTPVTASFSNLQDSAQDFYIGDANTGNAFHDGRIDQVGYWTRVLSGAEITFLYNSGAGRTYAEIAPTPTVNDYRIIPPTLNFIQPAGQLAIVPATA